MTPYILLCQKFYLFTNWWTSELSLKNNIKIYIKVKFKFLILFLKTTH